MKFRKLGTSSIELPVVGLGCMGMSTAYGQPDDAESIAVLRRALEIGVIFWDTADIYGNGTNEELIAKVLTGNRDKIFIATKFGFRMKGDKGSAFAGGESYIDCSPAHIKNAVEASLKRLKTDVIDLYYMHRPDPNIPVEESVGAMAELVRQGKVRYLGLSECPAGTVRRAHATHPIAALQSEYSLLTRDVEEEILPLTRELDISFIPFAPLGRGLMGGKLDAGALNTEDFRKRLPRYSGKHWQNNSKLAAEFALLAADKKLTPAQLALAWVIGRSDNIITIPGTKRRNYLEENAAAADITLSAADFADVEKLIGRYPDIGPRYGERENKFIRKD